MKKQYPLLILISMFICNIVYAAENIWDIKAIHPKGMLLDVKAFDKKGTIYDVKAIQEAGNMWVLDIRAIVDGKKLPVKILVSDEKYSPVKAIGGDGTTFDIKALAPNGDKLDIKGVSSSGNIIHIKAIGLNGELYDVKAIQVYDVKGIKMSKEHEELKISGVPVHAHIKALPQPPGSAK